MIREIMSGNNIDVTTSPILNLLMKNNPGVDLEEEKFEEEFIDDNYELLNRRVAAQNDVIVTIGETAERMFFIDSGSVRIISGQNKLIANLGAGSCFGESALFNAGLCTHKVIANSKTNLLAIHREQVEIEINQEPPIVRLIALLLIKRLEVMNTLRERDQSSLG